MITYLNRTPDEFFRFAGEVEVDHIHLIGSFPEGRYSHRCKLGWTLERDEREHEVQATISWTLESESICERDSVTY